MKITQIFLFTFLIPSIFTFPSYSGVYKNTELCKSFKVQNFTCYPDESEIRVELKSSYVNLFIKSSENSIELKCNQRHVVNLSNLKNLPHLNQSKISKLTVSGCVIGDNLFFSKFSEKLNLKSLKSLDLNIKVDKTKKIIPEIFAGLESAIEMKFYTHSNHTFDKNSFQKFERLSVLSLHVYDLIEPQIPTDLFNDLKQLNSLSIFNLAHAKKQENKLLDLMITDFINLEIFTLQGIRWPFQLHLKLPRILRTIEIKNNHKIINLDENCFKKNENIEKIDLSNNSIAELHPMIFWSQSQLEKIDLSFNMLTNLSSELFSKNDFLEIVDLSNNHLETLGM